MSVDMRNISETRRLNPFLAAPCESNRGGGSLIEEPSSVTNIVFQTRGAELDPFEASLADALMQAFAEDHVELGAVTTALNQAGQTDSDGAAWTEASLEKQLAASAGRLFAISGSSTDV
jgi:hypothetical protein